MQGLAASSRPPELVSSSPIESPRLDPRLGIVLGFRFVIMCLAAVPPLVAALAGSGLPRIFSAIIFAVFAALVPATLYLKRGGLYLALASASLLVVSFATIPSESTVFSVDRWAGLVMFLLALTATGKVVPSASDRD